MRGSHVVAHSCHACRPEPRRHRGVLSKLQIPSSNIQRNSKLQFSKMGPRITLMFGYWSFSGAWMLELGAFRRFLTTLLGLFREFFDVIHDAQMHGARHVAGPQIEIPAGTD